MVEGVTEVVKVVVKLSTSVEVEIVVIVTTGVVVAAVIVAEVVTVRVEVVGICWTGIPMKVEQNSIAPSLYTGFLNASRTTSAASQTG